MTQDLRIMSWNVNGIRSALKKGFLEWLASAEPDILCLQETKLQVEQIPPELIEPLGYRSYWACAQKKGYSGVAVYTRTPALNVSTETGDPRFDAEGRFLRVDFEDFTLFNVYFPNGKMNSDRLQYKMDFYEWFLGMLEELRKTQPRLMFVGDVNTAHQEIDLARPKENSKISGFLPMEREWMDKVISAGYVDTFRTFHPDTVKYSWWNQQARARERDVGWRIDYVFVTQEFRASIKSAFILTDVMGSDHCPVGVETHRALGSGIEVPESPAHYAPASEVDSIPASPAGEKARPKRTRGATKK